MFELHLPVPYSLREIFLKRNKKKNVSLRAVINEYANITAAIERVRFYHFNVETRHIRSK